MLSGIGGSRKRAIELYKRTRDGSMMPTAEGGADTKADITYGIDGLVEWSTPF